MLTAVSAGLLGLALYSLIPVLSSYDGGSVRGRGRAALIGALVFLVPYAIGAALAAIVAFRRADELRHRQLGLLLVVVTMPVGAGLLVQGADVMPRSGMRSAALDPSQIQRSSRMRRYRKNSGQGRLNGVVAAAAPPPGGWKGGRIDLRAAVIPPA